jgi:hypothetical protein
LGEGKGRERERKGEEGGQEENERRRECLPAAIVILKNLLF